MFRHVPSFGLKELSSVTSDSGRFYTTPDGAVYPSVTTVLSKGTDHSWLEEWRERVGDAEVARVQRVASQRGTAVHDMAEKYLLNDPDWKKGQMPISIMSFNKIRPYLDEHVGLIAGLELPLYSDKLRVAGRTDLIAKWDGVWSIIDFKTSRVIKTKEDIINYFLQASCYSYMFYERTGMLIKNIVILMTVDEGNAIVFKESVGDYIEEFIRIRRSVDL